MSEVLERIKSYMSVVDKGVGRGVTGDIVKDNVGRAFWRTSLELIQAGALATGPADLVPLQEALTTVFGRAFIKNDTGADVTIRYNNLDWVLSDGVTYSMHPDEARFFIEKALEDGIDLDTVNLAEYLTTGNSMAFLS
jgi:hypothetical protein